MKGQVIEVLNVNPILSQNNKDYTILQSSINQALNLLIPKNAVVELRIPNVPRQGTVSGYFNDMNKLVEEASRWSGRAPGIYITINEVNPALLARAVNRARALGKNDKSTSDTDIIRRRILPIDLDPVRPAGISSTNEENENALERAKAIRTWLTNNYGWPTPVLLGGSGNGAHIPYVIDLPNNQESMLLIQKVLKVLDLQFSDELVKVDLTTFNASRVWKLYGTMACKGDSTPERPHRMSKILEHSEKVVVTIEQLKNIAALLPEETKTMSNRNQSFTSNFDLVTWIRDHGLSVSKEGSWQNGGHKWILDICPFDSNHTDNAAYIVQQPNGAIGAGCQHDGCKARGWGWRELRELYEPESRERREKAQSKREVKAGKTKTATTRNTAQIIELPTAKVSSSKSFNLTDLGNGERLVAWYGQDIRFLPAWNKWLIWDGKRWSQDGEGRIMRKARDTVRRMYSEAAGIEDDFLRKQEIKHAIKSEANRQLKSMVEVASILEEIPITPDHLDQDPWLLNCLNGTIDLKKGKLMIQDREQLITKLATVEFDPTAKAPTWLAFLEKIMAGNQNLIRFLQKAVGYSLTGSTREQVMLILHGAGANGKSTFLEAIACMMGNEYTQQTPTSTLMAKKGEGGIPNDIARLKGARFVSAVEAEEGQRLAESLVKQMTGGDRLTARFMRSEFFEFKPEFKLWLGTNHKPQIRGTDAAIWRRIRLIPFIVTIPPEDRDLDLPTKLRNELAGILAWAVEGCLLWQKEGLGMPVEVMAATDIYRTEMDAIGAFIEDACTIHADAKESVGDLYREYTAWAEENGERALNKRQLSQRLGERGFVNVRGTGGWYFWQGFCLTHR